MIEVEGELGNDETLDDLVVELERLDMDTFEALELSYEYLVGRGLSSGSVQP